MRLGDNPMSSFAREEFENLLVSAAHMSIEVAQEQVNGTLPHEIRWELTGFERSGKGSSLEQIVEILYRSGHVPVIVDVFVTGVLDAFTIIRVRPSGHQFVDDITKTWNTPAGMGPFKPQGLILSGRIWKRPRPLSLDDLQEAVEGWPSE